jgi:predicted AAA+ superfamily ATPase
MNGPIPQVIKEYWEKNLPPLKQRDITLFEEKNFINDIVGPRRAGKTYLMYLTIQKLREHLDKEATVYINFENRKLMPLQETYFNDIIEFIYAENLLEKYGTVYLFLDEVQRIEGWEHYIRSIYDEFKEKVRIYISGSSANLLSKEYAKLLTGRHLTTQVFPLSFLEFLHFQGLTVNLDRWTEREEARMKKALSEYVKTGGFPDVVLGQDKDAILSQLFTDIVSRDVLSRTTIRKANVVEEFSYYLASNIGNLLSFNKMKNYFASRGIKISVPTLTNYFWHFKNAFLFFDSTIFSYTVKDQLLYPRKIYCVDTGLANASGFKTTEDTGRLYENMVAIELLRKGYEIYYWKTKQQEEVDFVVKKGMQVVQLIQVCMSLTSDETFQREVKALLKALNAFNLNEGMILTDDLERTESIDGKTISMVPMWKWLVTRS